VLFYNFFLIKIPEYTWKFSVFLFINFRAYFKHFSQSKPTFIINWKIFSGSGTTRILIFMKVQLVRLELFAFFIMFRTRKILFLLHNFRAYFMHFDQSKSTSIINWKLFSGSETTCISIYIKVQLVRLELFAVFITILTHEFYFFCSVTLERNLSTLVKENRPPLLIESCSACSKLLASRFSWRYSWSVRSYSRFL
jgi:hypothetical protein